MDSGEKTEETMLEPSFILHLDLCSFLFEISRLSEAVRTV